MKARKQDVLKILAVVLAILALFLIFLLGLSLFPSTQSLLNDNAHPVSIVITLAFIGGGLVALFSNEARRQRQRAADISSVGMAALVDPLLEIGLNFYELRRDPQKVIRAWDTVMKEPDPPTRLKWAYGRDLRKRQILGDWDRDWVPLNHDEDARRVASQMSDQAVRRLMGSLRSWADLLAVTSLGETAMVAIADLRLRLFELSERCAGGVGQEEEQATIPELISECALRSLLLAMIFEACGGASRPRSGFVSPLDRWTIPEATGIQGGWGSRFVPDRSDKLDSPVDTGLALLASYGEELTRLGPRGGTSTLAVRSTGATSGSTDSQVMS